MQAEWVRGAITQSAVNVYYLLDDRTTDQHIAELIAGKREKVARATGDTQPAQQPIDTFDIARQLGDGQVTAPHQTTPAADRAAAPRVDPEVDTAQVDDVEGYDVPAPAASDGG